MTFPQLVGWAMVAIAVALVFAVMVGAANAPKPEHEFTTADFFGFWWATAALGLWLVGAAALIV